MTNEIDKLFSELESVLITAYEEGTSVLEAEKHAAKFLRAQMMIASTLATSELNTRMRKSGVKSIRAAVYLDEARKGDKKPTESALEHLVNQNSIVATEQQAYDTAEVESKKYERYYDIFREGHIYFRGIAKGGGAAL